MNKILILLCIPLFFILGCTKDKHENHAHEKQSQAQVKSYYTCSMHPQIKQDKPGKCPICHMNLTKVEVEDLSSETFQTKVKDVWRCKDHPDITSEVEEVCPIDGTPMIKATVENRAGEVVAKVKLRKSQVRHFNPELFPVSKMIMRKEIRLLGTVLQSEEKESKIPARIPGRVEKVYIKSTGSLVKKGDPVIDLYSPELITAGEEYLLARKSYAKSRTKEFKDMLSQSVERLKLWGIKDFQYEEWFKNQKIPNAITIYSPASGVVQKRNAVQGKYFKEGQNFFELSELSTVWVEMDVYEHDSGLVSLGQVVELEFKALPGEKYSGKVDFINPVLETKSRTLKIRTTIQNNSSKLKPGMVADATLGVTFEGKPLVVPRSAVIDTGKRKVVWVKVTDKLFQAKTVLSGNESQGYVEIKSGLMEGEGVVIEGNFLLDSQAQLFGGYEDFKTSSTHQH